MAAPTYFDVEEDIAEARDLLLAAENSRDVDDMLWVLRKLLETVEALNRKDAPK